MNKKNPNKGWIKVERAPGYSAAVINKMPRDGEEIIISTKYDNVFFDVCGIDGKGYYLESGLSWYTDVVAWRPKPKHYKQDLPETVEGGEGQ